MHTATGSPELYRPYGLLDVTFNIRIGGNIGAAIGPGLGGFSVVQVPYRLLMRQYVED